MPRPAGAGPAGPVAVPAGAPLAVALFNDGGDHIDVGGLAISQALRRLLRRRGAVVRHAFYRGDWRSLDAEPPKSLAEAGRGSSELQRTFADVDAVVVDGGRSLCGGRGRHLLAILGAAQHQGLPTFLVNAVIDRLPDDDGRDILAALTDCAVPDEATSRLLRAHRIAHRRVPDALFAAEFLETPIQNLRQHLVLLDLGVRAQADAAVTALRAAWEGPVHDYAVTDRARALDWRHTVANLRLASAIVCGSHHAACLAMAAGVPFVRIDADDLPYVAVNGGVTPYPAAAADRSRPLPVRVEAAIADAAAFSALGSACAYLLPLETFAGLVPGLAPYSRGEGALGSIDDALEAVRRTTPIGGSVLHAGSGTAAWSTHSPSRASGRGVPTPPGGWPGPSASATRSVRRGRCRSPTTCSRRW